MADVDRIEANESCEQSDVGHSQPTSQQITTLAESLLNLQRTGDVSEDIVKTELVRDSVKVDQPYQDLRTEL